VPGAGRLRVAADCCMVVVSLKEAETARTRWRTSGLFRRGVAKANYSSGVQKAVSGLCRCVSEGKERKKRMVPNRDASRGD
jgi:hypothetical protein